MQKNKIVSKILACFLLISLCLSFISNATAATIYCHGGKDPVSRAGVILVKKYGKNDYAILMGKDAKYDFISFPAGQVDKGEKYPAQAASRETYEETAKAVKLNAKKLSKKPHIYSKRQQIILYVVRDDSTSVRKVNKYIKKIKNNKKVARKYKEVSNYYAIPVKSLLKAAKKVKAKGYPKSGMDKAYYVVSRGNPKKGKKGKKLRVEKHYLRAVAKNVTTLEKYLRKMKAL